MEPFAFIIGAWVTACIVLAFYLRSSRNGGVGLPMAFVASFTMIHCAACIYLSPSYDPTRSAYLASMRVDRDEVADGLFLAFTGLASFCVGVVLRDNMSFRAPKAPTKPPSKYYVRALFFTGLFFYLVVFPVARSIPSGQAIAGAGINLVTVSIALSAIRSTQSKTSQWESLQIWFKILALPAATLFTSGYVGYGVNAALIVLACVWSKLRIQIWHLFGLLALGWFGLIFFSVYMKARDEVREARTQSERAALVWSNLLTKLSDADPFAEEQLYVFDSRLNHSSFIGRAMHHMAERNVPHSGGTTVMFAAVAWIPRAIWQNKPTFGGSGDLVSTYTGLLLSKTTSFGVGQVLEFYINFGWTGVIVGHILIGFIFRQLDVSVYAAIAGNNVRRATELYLLGVCLLQPQGVLAELVASSAAAVVVVRAMGVFLNRFDTKDKTTSPTIASQPIMQRSLRRPQRG